MKWGDILCVLFVLAILLSPYIITGGIVLFFRAIFRSLDIAINIGWHDYWSGDANIVECDGCGIRFTYKRYRELGHICSYCGSDLIHDTHQSARKYIP